MSGPEVEIDPIEGDGTVGPSPTQIESPELRREANRALIWALVVGLLVLAIYLSQSLLVVFGALVIVAAGAGFEAGKRSGGRS